MDAKLKELCEKNLLNYGEEEFQEVEAQARMYVDGLNDPNLKLAKNECLEKNLTELKEKRLLLNSEEKPCDCDEE